MANFLLRSLNCILRDHRSFFGKFSWGSSSYFIYFGLLAKTIRSVCQNCFLWALRMVLREKGFFSKNLFSMFFVFGSNSSWTFGKKFGWVAELPLEEPRGAFWEQGFFWKKILFFQTLRQKRSENGKKFRLRSLNCIIRDQKSILRNFFLRFGDLFCLFRISSENNSERLSKLLSMSPEAHFGKKIYFSDIEVFFQDVSTNSRHF